jgi:hypothetical protein
MGDAGVGGIATADIVGNGLTYSGIGVGLCDVHPVNAAKIHARNQSLRKSTQ